jgi:hypothetical protein
MIFMIYKIYFIIIIRKSKFRLFNIFADEKNDMPHSLLDYDPKILFALSESLKGDNKFTDFLFHNGYPELAAFSAAVHSDKGALQWLLKSNYPEFGVLSNAIDGETNAIMWLQKNKLDFLSIFAAACRKDDGAIRWFVDNKLDIFLMMIRTIHDELMHQSWDSSDIHRRRD